MGPEAVVQLTPDPKVAAVDKEVEGKLQRVHAASKATPSTD